MHCGIIRFINNLWHLKKKTIYQCVYLTKVKKDFYIKSEEIDFM